MIQSNGSPSSPSHRPTSWCRRGQGNDDARSPPCRHRPGCFPSRSSTARCDGRCPWIGLDHNDRRRGVAEYAPAMWRDRKLRDILVPTRYILPQEESNLRSLGLLANVAPLYHLLVAKILQENLALTTMSPSLRHAAKANTSTDGLCGATQRVLSRCTWLVYRLGTDWFTARRARTPCL